MDGAMDRAAEFRDEDKEKLGKRGIGIRGLLTDSP
jgi:hypothetical protein